MAGGVRHARPVQPTQPDDANGAVPIADSNEFANGYDVMMAKKISERLPRPGDRALTGILIPAVTTGQVDCVTPGYHFRAPSGCGFQRAVITPRHHVTIRGSDSPSLRPPRAWRI